MEFVDCTCDGSLFEGFQGSVALNAQDLRIFIEWESPRARVCFIFVHFSSIAIQYCSN